MPYNLKSPNSLLRPIELADVARWYGQETEQVDSEAVRHVLSHVYENLSEFVQWPKRAMLLWKGCDRIAPPDRKQKYHQYPDHICSVAKVKDLHLDSRPNGPAIAAFQLAGGSRMNRFGSTNAATIHHLYSGKFPYAGRRTTTHAVKFGVHFTQSAGVIAAHPVADALSDEYPFFAWVLRAESFRRFGYDPDGVFSKSQDKLGFARGSNCEILYDAEARQA